MVYNDGHYLLESDLLIHSPGGANYQVAGDIIH